MCYISMQVDGNLSLISFVTATHSFSCHTLFIPISSCAQMRGQRLSDRLIISVVFTFLLYFH